MPAGRLNKMVKDKYTRRTYEDIAVGETAARTWKITGEAVAAFAAIIGDPNPAHLDEDYAKTTMFGGRIAHGMHTAALFSTLIATRIPGINGVYVSQEFKFIRPVRVGDEITAELVVLEKFDEKRRVALGTKAVNQKGELVVDGKGVIAVIG